jgi:molybdopterin converting factor small subunit
MKDRSKYITNPKEREALRNVKEKALSTKTEVPKVTKEIAVKTLEAVMSDSDEKWAKFGKLNNSLKRYYSNLTKAVARKDESAIIALEAKIKEIESAIELLIRES